MYDIDFSISGRSRQKADSTMVHAALTNCENEVTIGMVVVVVVVTMAAEQW